MTTTTQTAARARRPRRHTFEARLAASPSKLMRLGGLAEAIGVIDGGAAPDRHLPLREACHRIAAAHPCPPGPVEIEAVKAGRSIIGHRITDNDQALRIAHGVAARHTMDAIVSNGLAPAVAKRCGLRDARPRPWHSDPTKAEQLADLTASFFAAFRPFLVDGDADCDWRFALVVPHPPKGSAAECGADALVAKTEDGSNVEFIHLSDEDRPLEFDPDRTQRMRLAISRCLSNHSSRLTRSEDVWRLDSHGFPNASMEIADQEWPRPSDYGFWKRFHICWERTLSNGMAHLRRRLPIEIQDHAALSGRQFADLRRCFEFFSTRQGWSVRDYLRANQAIRAAPILRNMMGVQNVTNAIRDGRPLAEVIRAALASAGRQDILINTSLHPKTIKSLRNSYRLAARAPEATLSCVADVIPVVDAIYKTNPHHPILSGRELDQIGFLARLGNVPVPLRVKAALAHRDAKGRIRPCQNLMDAYNWVSQRVAIALIGTDNPPIHARLPIATASYDILFPEGRSLAGVSALNREWHTHQNRLDTDLRLLLSSMVAARLAEITETTELACLFPHFLDRETKVDGVMMRPLTDEEAIFEEGQQMHHCLSGYAGSAAAGRSMLVSQVSEAGRSTVEIFLKDETESSGSRWLMVAQNQAYDNTEPPASHVKAIEKLMKSCSQEFLATLAERVNAASLLQDKHRADLYRSLPQADIQRISEHSFASLNRFMPRQMRKLSRREWSAQYPIPAVKAEDAIPVHHREPAFPF